MNKNEFINSNVLSNRQREFKSELWDEYNAARRKSNVFGGIISAVAAIYISSKYLGCDYSGAISDTDKIKTAAVFIGLLFLWRMIRQTFMQKSFQRELPFGEEEKAAVEKMTPQDAADYLREKKEHKDSCKAAKNSGNGIAFLLILAVVLGYAYAVQKGLI